MTKSFLAQLKKSSFSFSLWMLLWRPPPALIAADERKVKRAGWHEKAVESLYIAASWRTEGADCMAGVNIRTVDWLKGRQCAWKKAGRPSGWNWRIQSRRAPGLHEKASLWELSGMVRSAHVCTVQTHWHTDLPFLLFPCQRLLSVFIMCSICLQCLPCLTEGVYIIMCAGLRTINPIEYRGPFGWDARVWMFCCDWGPRAKRASALIRLDHWMLALCLNHSLPHTYKQPRNQPWNLIFTLYNKRINREFVLCLKVFCEIIRFNHGIFHASVRLHLSTLLI